MDAPSRGGEAEGGGGRAARDPLLFALLLVAAALRLVHEPLYLPSFLLPDEIQGMTAAFRILWSGSLETHFYKYPGFLIHLGAIANGIVLHFLALARGVPVRDFLPSFPQGSLSDVVRSGSILSTPLPYVVGRTACALLDLGTVALSYRVGDFLGGRRSARIAAALTALDPVLIWSAGLFKTEAPLTLWCFGSAYAALRLEREGGGRNALVAGICAGLAMATKYNGVAVVPFLVVWARRPSRARLLALFAAGYAGAAFLAAPYLFLDPGGTLAGLSSELRIIRSSQVFFGTSWSEARRAPFVFQIFTILPWMLGPAVWLLAWPSLARLSRRGGEGLVLLSFPAAYFVFVCLTIPNALWYYYHPLLPFVHVAVAGFLARRRGLLLGVVLLLGVDHSRTFVEQALVFNRAARSLEAKYPGRSVAVGLASLFTLRPWPHGEGVESFLMAQLPELEIRPDPPEVVVLWEVWGDEMVRVLGPDSAYARLYAHLGDGPFRLVERVEPRTWTWRAMARVWPEVRGERVLIYARSAE